MPDDNPSAANPAYEENDFYAGACPEDLGQEAICGSCYFGLDDCHCDEIPLRQRLSHEKAQRQIERQ